MGLIGGIVDKVSDAGSAIKNGAKKVVNAGEDAVDAVGDAGKAVGKTVVKGVQEYGDDALRIGAIAAAGTGGFLIGGPAGAAAAGGLTAAAISTGEQAITTGRIDPLKVARDGAFGAIPLPLGGQVAGRLGLNLAGRGGTQALGQIGNRFGATALNTATKYGVNQALPDINGPKLNINS